MFRKIRKHGTELTPEKVQRILKQGIYGVLATLGLDGYPYATPYHFVYVNDCLYIHTAKIGHVIDNLSYHENVSFCIVDNLRVIDEKFTTEYESIILFGKAIIVKDDEKQKILDLFIEKYAQKYTEKSHIIRKQFGDKVNIVKIQIDNITGKKRVVDLDN